MQEIKTILAIDDDITILTHIRTILEGAYEVRLAKNAEIAKKILTTTEVDLILLDINMPGESGLEFLKIIQKNPSFYHIPVIIVSSQGTIDVIMNIKESGVDYFVVKPISSALLMEKVRVALKKTRSKINSESLARKLKSLENACTSGKVSQAEEIVKNLELVYYDMETDIIIADICKLVKEMDYSIADEKIKQLLTTLPE